MLLRSEIEGQRKGGMAQPPEMKGLQLNSQGIAFFSIYRPVILISLPLLYRIPLR